MAPRREILDSEDEGSDFSPIKEAVGENLDHLNRDAHGEDQDQPHVEPQDDITNTSSLKSTDPSFFRRVYEEQRVISHNKNNVSNQGPAPEADMSLSQPMSQPKGSSSLTSIADPGMTRQPRKPRDATKTDIVDLNLTQLTTPKREVTKGNVDPWEVPSSPLPNLGVGSASKSASKELKTYGKRKRISQQSASSQPSHDPYDFPSTADPSPARTTKKTKRGMQSPLPTLGEDSSPVMLVPRTEEEGSSARRSARKKRPSLRSLGQDSVIPETGLYVTPSALTASQKQQYQLVSLSSDPGQEALEPALPVMPLKSSMATTIAYSTPSRFGSSARRAEPPTAAEPDPLPSTADPYAFPSTAGPEVPSEPIAQHEPSSSPDVIAEEPRRAKRGKPKKPPLETRSTRKRKSAEYQSNQLNDNEDGGRTELDGTPVKRSGRKRQETQKSREDDVPPPSPVDEDSVQHLPLSPTQDNTYAPNPDTENNFVPLEGDEDYMPEAPIQAPTQAPKKRGRKRKEAVVEDEVDEFVPETNPVSEPVVEQEPPTKKRRGRPRKSALPDPDIPAPELPNGDGIEPPAPPPSTAKPGRRGRKKKEEVAKSPEYVVEEVEKKVEPEPEADPALGEASQNSRLSARKTEINASDDDDDDYDIDGDTKENETSTKAVVTPPKAEVVEKKEVKKAAPVISQTAAPKVPLRVGLSKKSRIAPLLRIIRK
ncbi:hypothetical protein B0T16DRAFT_404012 [Cercophora newfieldiana]|uniref:Uncharacterized protein n=1 Tax=Cercophora newfieldiana TaxID=92897 RepID=A0AA39YF43_9PEZI|nr:hypothetical protein B0T16DRAFT_404012 [Cercophora newfieldiana]